MKTDNIISKEKICIKGGLGPIRNSEETEFNILPVTIFIGPPVRVAPEKMAAYLFSDGKAENITDGNGQIDESLLGEVSGDLEVEFNRLTTYKVLWE